MHKLGIIVPYRARDRQLLIFKRAISIYLNNTNIAYELIIVEQDDAKIFNRGKLLNIGFLYAKKLKCDYVVFHDVDMIPVNVDYSYSPYPVQLSTKFTSADPTFNRIVFDEYFGGVTLFPSNIFETINGYPNEYWGWGYEDNDLLFRCRQHNIDLYEKKIKLLGSNAAALKFNGKSAYVKTNNVIDPNTDTTIFISFSPEDIYCDIDKYDDTYSIFTIAGVDMSINYNSYARYNFEIYDEDENIIYLNSDIKPNYKTIICITIDSNNKELKMYQDGILIGTKNYTKDLYSYRKHSKIYLGAGNPNRNDNPKFFNGLMDSFAIFGNVLNEMEIKEISENKYFGLTSNFGNYISCDNLKLYFDAKFIKGYKMIDLSGNGNDGIINECEIVPFEKDDYKILTIPHRRDCEFELMSHSENGYVDGAWKDITTRYNQIRYFNEVSRGHKSTKEDGLNNCIFKELSNSNVKNQTHINVSI